MMSAPSVDQITKAMVAAVEINAKLKSKFNATVSFIVDGGEPLILHCTKSGDENAKPDMQVKTSLQTL
jgi:hypothetical protein